MSRKNMFYWQSDRPYSVEEIKKIFLARKDDYSKEEFTLACTKAMGEEVVLHDPINHGSVNIVCPFTTNSGKEGIIRAHPKEVRNEYFYSEKEAMKLAKTVDVPVPETITVDCSRQLVPFDYMITTRIPGTVMKVDVALHPSLHSTYLMQLGSYLGKLHSVKTTAFGFFDNEQARLGKLVGQYSSNQDHFLAAIDLDEEFHEINSGHIDPLLIKKSFKLLRSSLDLTNCDTPTLVHNDIADWNTVVSDGQVTGVLDWDECFSGDPVFEFATMSLFYSDEQMDHVKRGYERIRKLPDNYGKKYDLYLIRYILNKSKIAIKQLNSRQNDFMKLWLANAVSKLEFVVDKLK